MASSLTEAAQMNRVTYIAAAATNQTQSTDMTSSTSIADMIGSIAITLSMSQHYWTSAEPAKITHNIPKC